MKYHLMSKFAFHVLMFFAIIPFLVSSFYSAAAFDQYFFPPVKNFQAIDYERGEGYIRMHLIGIKSRPCEIKLVRAWYDTDDGKVAAEITFEEPIKSGIPSVPRNIPIVGTFDFGWMTIRPHRSTVFYIVTVHRCNPFYDHVTTHGPFTYQAFLSRKERIREGNEDKIKRFLGIEPPLY